MVSSNIEFALISSIVSNKDFHTVNKLQIDEGFFTSPEAREVFKFLRNTYFDSQTHGQVPSVEMVKYHYPSFFFTPSHDTVAILAQELRRERIRTEILKLSQDLSVLADKDPFQALQSIRAESAKLASMSEAGSDLPLSNAHDILLSRYEAVQSSQGLLGIPYPWQAMNEETQGMQPSQFIIIYGRPKSMKSWIAIHEAVHAYLNSRKRVLFYTREMSTLLVAQRVACALTKVDYKSFKNGTLQPEIKQHVFTILKELIEDEKGLYAPNGKNACFIITTDRSGGASSGGGVGWLQSKIRDVKPDIVFVDGMYLMRDDRSGQRTVDWKAMAHISQDLKLTAQDFDIPLVGVTQATRAADKSKGEDLTELAYADAFGQDADAVFRVSKKDIIDENNQKRTELSITAPGLREGKFDGIVVRGEPATSFDYLKTIIDLEAEEASKNESSYGSKGSPSSPFKKGDMAPKIPLKTLKSVK